MYTLLIITEQESAFSQLLKKSFDCCDLITPEQILTTNLDRYDAFAVLGGTQQKGITLLPPMRKALDKQIFKGKKCFAEFVHGIGQTSFLETKSTRFARPVLIKRHEISGTLEPGVIFDEQCNDRLFVYKATNRTTPILQYADSPKGFYSVPDVTKIQNDLSSYALWQEGDNLLVCAFRMCNFSKAKFAPRPAWAKLVSGIVNWLGGHTSPEEVLSVFREAYTLSGKENTIAQAAERAVNWFHQADMLVSLNGIPYCVKEGLTADVHADGSHVLNETIRIDCTGETALAFLLHGLWKKSEQDLAIANGLYRMPLDMVITEDCPHKGMIRGSIEAWWQVSYSDCRGFVLPMLFRQLLTGDREHEAVVRAALDYLVSTSGSDGLRCIRIDFYDQYSDEVEALSGHAEMVTKADGTQHAHWRWGGGISGKYRLSDIPGLSAGYPSVHYNGYSLAAMLFAYKLTGEKRYLETGVKGIESIMRAYPFTAPEHSETQEYCRFIFPLAMLYWVSDKPEHKEWLYRVARDLQRFRHPEGGYIEWDTDYTAACAGVQDGESSVLCQNGDPIMDLLYSLNWLPMGFAVAHYVTGDKWFKQLWEEICGFLASIQIKSDNTLINGVWPRAFDADLREVYGVPNDVGWAPWSVETGWTMSPIAIGMMLGLMEDEVKPRFDALQ